MFWKGRLCNKPMLVMDARQDILFPKKLSPLHKCIFLYNATNRSPKSFFYIFAYHLLVLNSAITAFLGKSIFIWFLVCQVRWGISQTLSVRYIYFISLCMITPFMVNAGCYSTALVTVTPHKLQKKLPWVGPFFPWKETLRHITNGRNRTVGILKKRSALIWTHQSWHHN